MSCFSLDNIPRSLTIPHIEASTNLPVELAAIVLGYAWLALKQFIDEVVVRRWDGPCPGPLIANGIVLYQNVLHDHILPDMSRLREHLFYAKSYSRPLLHLPQTRFHISVFSEKVYVF